MKWRATLVLILLALAALLLIWRWQGGDRGLATARLSAGKLYPYTADRVDGLEIVYPQRSFHLEREDGDWRLSAPMADLADSAVVGRIVATLEEMDAHRWLPPPTAQELVDYGLDSPRLELRLHRGGARDTLRFGALNPVEQRLWVQTSWRDSLVLVSTLLRSNSMKGRYELTDKRPLGKLAEHEVKSLRIENARGVFELGRGARGWEILRPEAYRADDATVKRMLARLLGESVIDFLDLTPERAQTLGFERPTARLSLTLKDSNRPRILELGRPYHLMHHARDLDREPVFLLDSLTCAPLLESFSAFMSNVMVNFLPGQVRRIAGPEGIVLRREAGETWVWRDQKGESIGGRGVAGLLNRLMRIPTQRVEALLPRRDQITAWGLDPPARSFTLEFKDGDSLVVEIGEPDGDRLYLRRVDYPTVYSVTPAELPLLWPLPPAREEDRKDGK